MQQDVARGKLIVLSGPGGVGKSTIVQELKKRDHFYFSVSATTRAPRTGEIDGEAYHFVSADEFQRMINNHVFLEWADFAGSRYGTPRGPVMSALDSGKDVLLEIEIEGARQVKRAMPEALMVFLQPPSMAELEVDKSGSKYSLVLYAAKRARQINAYYSQLGEGLLEYVGPLVETHVHEKPLSIAMREINDGLLTIENLEPQN